MIEDSYGAPGDAATELAAVHAIYDAFARRDLEAALAHMSPEIVLSLPATAQLAGRTEPYRGHAGVRAYFADMTRLWAELTLHAEDIRAISGGVVVFGSVSGRVGDEPVRRRVVWSWRLRQGLAVALRVDTMGPG